MNFSQMNFAKTHWIGTQKNLFTQESNEFKPDQIEIPNIL